MVLFFIILAAVILLLPVLSYLAIQGRSGHPGLDNLKGHSYAHRGLHGNGSPENSLDAFQKAKAKGYGVELDVHLTKDGQLVVIHDSTLDRVTGETGTVEELNYAQLDRYRLEHTQERIPTLVQVLELFEGNVPIILELKSHKGNHKKLTEAACQLMDSYTGIYCMESFDPRCLIWLKKHRPDIIRGQLSENYFTPGRPKMPGILRFILTHHLENFLTRPDFVAYRFSERSCTPTNKLFLKRHLAVAWTLTNQQDYTQAVSEGWLPIFEGFQPSS